MNGLSSEAPANEVGAPPARVTNEGSAFTGSILKYTVLSPTDSAPAESNATILNPGNTPLAVFAPFQSSWSAGLITESGVVPALRGSQTGFAVVPVLRRRVPEMLLILNFRVLLGSGSSASAASVLMRKAS